MIMDVTGWTRLGLELICVDGPESCEPDPALMQSLAEAGLYNEPRYSTWNLSPNGTSLDRIECNVAYVEGLMLMHNPVHAIAGICDGSLVALVVAARHPELQLYINFCGGPPSEYLPGLPSLKVATPSINVLGRADTMFSRAQLMEVSSLCENAVQVWHHGGHVIPAVSRSLRDRLTQHDSGKQVLFGLGAKGGVFKQIEEVRDEAYLWAEHTCEEAQAAFNRCWLSISARLSLTRCGKADLEQVEEELLVSRYSNVVRIDSRNIHLDVLTDAALELDGVREAVAVAARDAFGRENVVIFFVASRNADLLAIRIESCLAEIFLSAVCVQWEQSLPQLPTGAPDVPQLVARANHLLRAPPQEHDSLAMFQKTSSQTLRSNGIEGHMLFMSMFGVFLSHANSGLSLLQNFKGIISTNISFASVFAGGSFPMTICFMISGRSEAVADAGREYVRRKIFPLLKLIVIWLLVQPGFCTHYVPALRSAAPGLGGFLQRVAAPLTMMWFVVVLVICRIARFCAFSLGISSTRQAILATVVHLAASLRLIHQTPGERMFDMLKWILPPFASSSILEVKTAEHWVFVFFASPLCATV